MHIDTIKKAKRMAQVFIDHCDELLAKPDNEHDWNNPREYGLIRHASMLLTRLLADMRWG